METPGITSGNIVVIVFQGTYPQIEVEVEFVACESFCRKNVFGFVGDSGSCGFSQGWSRLGSGVGGS